MTDTKSTHQHPVLDRGGSRAREGTVTFVVPSIRFRLGLAADDKSSFGAMAGSRTVGFFEDSPRNVPCITRVVAVMGGGWDDEKQVGESQQRAGRIRTWATQLQQLSSLYSQSYEEKLNLDRKTS
jgi:hypothetical protein